MFESVEFASRPNWKLRIASAAIALALVAGFIWFLRMTQMPLRSYAGPLPPLSQEQLELRDRLSAHVRNLSVTIGERSMRRVGSLQATIEYIRDNLRQAGYFVTPHSA